MQQHFVREPKNAAKSLNLPSKDGWNEASCKKTYTFCYACLTYYIFYQLFKNIECFRHSDIKHGLLPCQIPAGYPVLPPEESHRLFLPEVLSVPFPDTDLPSFGFRKARPPAAGQTFLFAVFFDESVPDRLQSIIPPAVSSFSVHLSTLYSFL